MAEDIMASFITQKNDDSQWLSLKSGESVEVQKVLSITQETVNGFGGAPKQVLRFTCEVKTSSGVRTKWFDNGTKKFVTEVQTKGVKVGSSFTLTRDGEGTKTKYIVTAVK